MVLLEDVGVDDVVGFRRERVRRWEMVRVASEAIAGAPRICCIEFSMRNGEMNKSHK